MIAETKMPKEKMAERIEWIKEKINIESKVKSGAENLAKVYGHGLVDKKAMSDVFTKLVDSNTKINLLKIALQKYQIGLGVPVIEHAPMDLKSAPSSSASLVVPPGLATSSASPSVSSLSLSPKDDQKHWKRLNVTGRLRIRINGARNICPPHKKLEARCVIKVDAETAARTSVKSKTSAPVWNEEFDIDLAHAGDIEIVIYDRTELFALHFVDLARLPAMPPNEEQVLELEPRGELLATISFTAQEAIKDKIYRRGAVKKPKLLPMTMVRLLGFSKSVDMATKLHHEQTKRMRTARQQSRAVTGSGAFSSVRLGSGRQAAPAKPTARIEDFVLLKVLGKGNFGKVMLVEEKATRNLYAIKVLKKEFVIENDEVESIQAEKRVFEKATRISHPFLVKLHSSFQSSDRLFFVMEYVSGGDLMLHIQRQVFSEARAKLYGAEVLLALEYLHSQDVVYRDLKLDNILLGLDGHIKIADYGLCKEKMPYGKLTNTFCGTPEFMAPEILLERDYGRAVDWWAFGVLLYEMLLAQSPFKGEEEEEIFEAILEGDVYYPAKLSPEAANIIQRVRK